MQTATSTTRPALHFSDLINPMLNERTDTDGATLELEPVEQAALDVALSFDLGADEWAALGALVQQPRFTTALASLCTARAAEARRVRAYLETHRAQ